LASPTGARGARTLLPTALCLVAALFLGAPTCGGGGGGGSPDSEAASVNDPAPFLTVANVNTIVLQAMNEATARNRPATIAVVDRVGNVLAVTQMAGAPANATVTSQRGIVGSGLEGASVPSTLAAISKAITGAYLSSGGNAFTSRTASQIVQENFLPGELNQMGGPLFGVQFSQLPCSDVVRSFQAGNTGPGPMRAPLGLSADPGGMPIYKNGQVVGGIGVLADGVYTLDRNIFDFDTDVDELIAIAGASGFRPAGSIRADNITVVGRSLRYVDSTALAAAVSAPGAFVPLAVTGYFDGTVRQGRDFGTQASGIRADGGATYPGINAFVLDDGTGTNRYAPRAGLAPGGGVALTAVEARILVQRGLETAFRSRAQIRKPTDSFVQVTVSVVDTDGNVLALARTPDAPVFGTDVAVQKARSAAFLSRAQSGAELTALGGSFATTVTNMRSFVGAASLADGIAYTSRAIGNLARPFYPDGINAGGNGPLSLPFATWSPFSTGFQLALVAPDVVNLLGGGNPPAAGCAGPGQAGLAVASDGRTRLANGLQIFAGGVPVYRGATLVGAVGVSGDGIDQDDMVAFLAINNAGGALNNAAQLQRADTLLPQGTRLRYVNCPFAPFLDSAEQTPCQP
jgi:uncharacterized protein GlcG (DUF336 family)